MRHATSSISYGLLGALLLAAPALVGGCAGVDNARTAPIAEVGQAVPGVDAHSQRLQVVRRSFGGGYAMFELNRAVDPARLDLSKTRLMTVRPDANDELRVVEAAGDVFLDASRRVLAIELADTPRDGEAYRAVTVADIEAPGAAAEELDLGDLIVREPPASGADLANAVYVAPHLIARGIGGAATGGAPTAPTANVLQLASTEPADGSIDVARDIYRVTIKYSGATVDCGRTPGHLITGKAGFRLYSIDTASGARIQEMYDNMPVGYGDAPTIDCDDARNQISLMLPGPLLGGTLFRVDTQARATDGTTRSVSTTFRTRNPGLHVYFTKATNEIYKCDTHIPGFDSFKCDVYLVSQVGTRTSANDAWQTNAKIPGSGSWSDWSEDTSKTFYPPNQITLYQDALAVGDPARVEIQAFDADTGDGFKKALSFIGGVGKVIAPFYPPAGIVGEGLTQISTALPSDDDDWLGGGSYALPKSTRWGTIKHNHEFKLPGRPATSQIVVDFSVEEYPAPWYAPAIIQ